MVSLTSALAGGFFSSATWEAPGVTKEWDMNEQLST